VIRSVALMSGASNVPLSLSIVLVDFFRTSFGNGMGVRFCVPSIPSTAGGVLYLVGSHRLSRVYYGLGDPGTASGHLRRCFPVPIMMRSDPMPRAGRMNAVGGIDSLRTEGTPVERQDFGGKRRIVDAPGDDSSPGS